MRRAAILVVLAAGAFAAPSASGQAVFVGGPDTALQTTVKPTGRVTVSFHGDPAAGCEAAHVCGVTGSVTWKPTVEGVLFAFSAKDHGRRTESGFLSFGDEVGGLSSGSSARVRRAEDPDALCADAGASSTDAETVPRVGSLVPVSLTGAPGPGLGLAELFRTRCAGPATEDVASLLPTRLISRKAIRRGGATLDFSADGSFAAHGFAGTLHSTLTLRVRRAESQPDQSFPGPTHVVRTRFLEVDYRIESVSGQLVASVRGLSDPDLCGPLDACGLMGTVTVAPRASGGQASLLAFASARHSARELRRALGLTPGPRPPGVHSIGFVTWDRDGGSATSDLTRADTPACADSTPLSAGGSILLRFTRERRIRADYELEAPDDPLRTRCPGPGTADVAGSGGLASGTVPIDATRGRRLTLHLTRGRRFSADGYSGSTQADITVVARRTRVHGHVQTDREPTLP